MLAKRFSDYLLNENVLIFASGVSDSKLTDEDAYQRELELLNHAIQQHPDKLLVYFSTCSVYDKSLSNTPYIRHKFFVERLIQQNHPRYLIFRISNLVGRGGNPKTIINYLMNVVQNGIHFELWKNAYRNIIDIDDAYLFMHYFINQERHSEIINIANTNSYNTMTIVQSIELFTGKKADYTIVERGENFFIDTSAVYDTAKKLGVYFSDEYLFLILKKYYNPV